MKHTDDTAALINTPDISGCLDQGTFDFWITTATGIAIKDEIPLPTLRDLTKNVAIMFEASGKQHAHAAMVLGDILNFWEEKFPGEDATQQIETAREWMRVQVKTIHNWMWVASKVEPSRRRENLSLEHHVAVAKLPAGEQTEYLRLADDEGMSVTELKSKIKEAHPGKPRASKVSMMCKIDTTKPQAIGDALSILAGHFGAKNEEGEYAAELLDDWEPHLAVLEKTLRRLQRRNGKKR